jgi:DHA2 family multidrug resistance protein
VVIMLLPFVGFMVSRVDARYMIGFGFLALSGALFFMTRHLYGGIDFRTAIELRVIQSIGLPFLFIPINTLVYSGVPPEKNNAVSGIVNLSRNMGGDIGIAAVTTLIARRSQFHQAQLVGRTNNFDPSFTSRIEGLARSFERTGASAVEAGHKALSVVYFQLQQQAATLAFLDAIKMLAVATGLMIPLLFLTRKARPGGAPAGGH